MEWICGTSTIMARTEYGYASGVLLHFDECDLPGDFHAGFSWTSTYLAAERRDRC